MSYSSNIKKDFYSKDITTTANAATGFNSLQVLAFLSASILIFFLSLNFILNMPFTVIVILMMVPIIISAIGYGLSLRYHKKWEKNIMDIDSPIELEKEQYLKVPYISIGFLFISLIFAAIYVIALYPFLPIPITHLLSKEVYEYYDYTFLFLDVIFYLIASFALASIFRKSSPKNLRLLKNFSIDTGFVVFFVLLIIFISVYTVRRIPMLVIILTPLLIIGFVSMFEYAYLVLLGFLFYFTFFNLYLNMPVFLTVGTFYLGLLEGINITLNKGLTTLRKILLKWAILKMKESNTKEIQLELHKGLPQFSSGKVSTEAPEYTYLEWFFIIPLKKQGFIVNIKKKKKDPLRIVVEGITIKIPKDKLKDWEEKLITTLDHYSLTMEQQFNIKTLAKKSELKEEQVMTVLELSDNNSIKSIASSIIGK